ncbi:glycolate oxidase [Desulfosporosinus lacus DSM 15449]|uniref:Glycolate oxidase n=2 Tax=Desulfosporosinus TaxID=79206 RepID=A0A1M5ZP13_9FIRM|nr:glycolate oxidase [Desulfosporosinus lacus DSM 15449]
MGQEEWGGLRMSEIVQALTKIVDSENLLLELEDRMCYSYDGTFRTFLPDYIARPKNTQEIQEIVKVAVAFKTPLYTRGTGTGLSGGSVPVKGGIVMDLTRLNRILEIDAKNLVAIVEPGVITGDLHKAVEALGLYYPPDPASLKTCTMGGNVAEGAGGPRAIKYGVTRDYVMGLEVVTAAGELIRVGGRTVKNVSGYDLTRLFVGSEGTLGVITQIIVKLIPKPEAKKTIMSMFPKLDGAADTVPQIIAKGIIPAALEIMDDLAINCVENHLHMGLPRDSEAVLLIELDGDKEVVEKQAPIIAQICQDNGASEVRVAQNDAESEDLWKARRAVSAAIVQLNPTKVAEDATVPRTMIPEMIRRLKKIAAKYNLPMPIYGHAGDGNLHPNILTDRHNPEEMERVEKAVEEIFKTTVELGGTLSGEHGIGLMKAPFMKLQFTPEEIHYFREIKKVFDPQNILNPGKIFGGEESERLFTSQEGN